MANLERESIRTYGKLKKDKGFMEKCKDAAGMKVTTYILPDGTKVETIAVRNTTSPISVFAAYQVNRNMKIISAYDELTETMEPKTPEYEKYRELGRRWRLSAASIRRIIKSRDDYSKVK